jgi:ABC-type transporter Mla maintaining outer membrane lipid asymmetry ATPase subunit MlaF
MTRRWSEVSADLPVTRRRAADAAIEVRDLRKDCQGPRPILVRRLDVRVGEIVAIAGLDEHAAELFVDMITGAVLPDGGVVRVFGRDTRGISTYEQWLAWLERFGIVSRRAALLDTLTVAQNIAVPLTLDLFPLPDKTIAAVRALATDAGVAPEILDRAPGEIPSEMHARVRLARALALGPSLLLLEHPWAALARAAASAFAADVATLSRARGLTILALANDHQLNRTLADRLLTLEPATGDLRQTRLALRWFSGGHLSS